MINQKGGVGKTTASLNVSSFLASTKHKVLLIDMDPQGNTSNTLLKGNCDEDMFTSYHLLIASSSTNKGKKMSKEYPDLTLSDFILEIPIKSEEKCTIDLIPANQNLSESEVILMNSTSRENILSAAFEKYSKEISAYDFVIIDCPPSLGLLTINAFVASRYLMVPVDANAYSHEGLSHLINSLGGINEEFNSKTEILGVFFSIFAKNEKVYQESFKYLKSECGERLFDTVINRSTLIHQAPHKYQTIYEYAPKSQPYNDYENLTTEMLEKIHVFSNR